MVSWEFVIAIGSAIGSALTSRWAVKTIIKHETDMCDKRLEAFKEGLDRNLGEKS